MARWESIVLTNHTSDLNLDRWEMVGSSPSSLGVVDWSLRKFTMRAGLSAGVECLEVDNGRLAFTLLPTRGMGVWKGRLGDVSLGWNAPVKGPVHPHFVNQEALNGLGWLQGFDEWIVRCGLQSNGPPTTDMVKDGQGRLQPVKLTLHGRIANLPAHYLEVRIDHDPPHTLEIIGHVDESGLFQSKLRLVTTYRTWPGARGFEIIDQVHNLGGQPAEMQLLYHINFGPPLLEPDSRFRCPVRMVSPRDQAAVADIDSFNVYRGPVMGTGEFVHYLELFGLENDNTLALLHNAKGDLGCAVRFSQRQLPCFTLWKYPAPTADGYVTGLEPGTNFPNARGFERQQQRVVTIPIQGAYETTLRLEIANTSADVTRLVREVEEVQCDRTLNLYRKPVKPYADV